MSVLNDLSREHTEQLAVLYCDVHSPTGPASNSRLARWRANYLRAARQLVEGYGGESAITVLGGSASLFSSSVEALLCARALATLPGSDSGGPSLSGGLSAGEVTRGPDGISGQPVLDAIALCQRAGPHQVLVANPMIFVAGQDIAGVLSPSSTGPTPVLSPHGAGAGRRGSLRHRPVDASRGRMRHLNPGPFRSPFDERHPDRGRPSGGTVLRLLETEPPEATEPTESARLRAVTLPTEPAPRPRPAAPTTDPAPARPAAPALVPDKYPGGLRLTVLGWVQMEAGEPPVPRAVLRGCQARSVVSMLALRHGPVHKDELAELLWPDNLPDHWEGAVRGLITKIRRFLDEGGVVSRETLIAEGGYYELRLPPAVAVDRDEASAWASAAKAALAEGRASEAVRLVRRSVSTLKRRLMSGEDNPWFDQFRSELDHERMAALDLLAQAELQSANFERAEQAASEALILDPYRESAYRLLMETHAAAGSRGEALRTYERCRKVLAEELGVGPAPQTQALYLDLLG